MSQNPTPINPARPSTDPIWPAATGSLQAPWRLEYLETLAASEPAAAASTQPQSARASPPAGGSFLSEYWLRPDLDEHNHVVVRIPAASSAATGGMILLNGFPYANGHLLVALGMACGTLTEYSATERAMLWRLTDAAAALMQITLEPQGINIGVNQGRAAGAGVPQHLHVHLVPRWSGDVNFMTVVPRIRVIPSPLEAMARRYRSAWERIKETWLPLIESGN
ncbi:MAG: HIT domain-containing protein [Pyrinomonadaceae bacterium]|nr:HIT domain-containing protein [Phycisphaerales bacterium]